MDLVYEPLQRFARRRCSASEADDLVAEALLVLWRRLDDVPVDAPLPWSYRVAGNCLANARRADRRRLRLVTRLTTAESATPPGPEPPDPALHAALRSLTSADQELLRLWAWEQLGPSEISIVLDISSNAAAIRLHRAKQRLSEALQVGKDRPPPGHEGIEDLEQMP
ncbi:MAG: RNA polymerase sigma factor [Microthrixaceae bacterium]